MKAVLACMGILLSACQVSGNVLAGPYQTMWLWYAYRMDGMTSSPSLAAGCSGSLAGGRCTFDEFLKYIDKPIFNQALGSAVPWTGSTNVGDNLDPDVQQTAKELSSVKYPNNPDNSKLLSQFKPGVQSTFSQVMGAVMDVVQNARKQLGDTKLATQVAAAAESWLNIHTARVIDQASALNEEFKNEIQTRLKINPEDVPMKTLTAPDGTTYEEVDSQKLMDDNPAMKANKIKFLQTFPATYVSKGSGKSHFNAIVAAQALEGRINDPNMC